MLQYFIIVLMVAPVPGAGCGAPTKGQPATHTTSPADGNSEIAALQSAAASYGVLLKPISGAHYEKLERRRFQWKVTSLDGAVDLRLSFGMSESELKELPIDTLLIPMVDMVARNLVNDGGNGGRVCDPVESSSMAAWFGADRVIAVCFEPASWFAPGRHATLYGIYKKDVALVYVAVLREKESQIDRDSALVGFLRFQ